MVEPALTAEDEARAMLLRAGAQGPFSSGDLVELANLIDTVGRITWAMADMIREIEGQMPGEWEALGDLLESLLPPRGP